MADPLQTGIIGTGGWGTHIAEQFHEHSDAEVVALADVSSESRTRAGETLEVSPSHQYENHRSMLEREGLDAVQISSPHEFHHEQTIAALEEGVHVFCEKPLTPGLERACDLARRVEESDRVLMVGYQRHVNPAYVAIRETIAAGDLEPKLVTAELTQDWVETVADSWRMDPDLSGGGQLYDSGSHLLDAVIWLLDDVPTRVSAEMAFHDEPPVDVQAALSVRFERGTVANITVSGDSPDVTERIAVRGDGGRCLLEGSGWTDRNVTITDSSGDVRRSVAAGLSSYDKVDAFVESVRIGTEPPATATDALRATALTEAAYDSARRGERVSVEPN
ncbi:Gfo/Idh/MocA family protein [Halostagnicola kamekurae]|uniref:Predicted dehydrogenase n=1 Tax=Halostagnicola kamekurae TaxID=619731 RepID=A0A1I6TKX1_9EURY|nr:Gfo/Idh/MocA family oxidoreductase [Halostagnicola kamekurae]SFS89791.1 Predicted dehydrogenase [Halostagnicola kamekurae]